MIPGIQDGRFRFIIGRKEISMDSNNMPSFGQFPNFANYNRPNNQMRDERIWVPSYAAAEAYLVAPGSFVRLWDSNSNLYYEKTTDYSGRPMPIRIFEYKEMSQQMESPANNYVSREDFIALQTKVDEFINSFEFEKEE